MRTHSLVIFLLFYIFGFSQQESKVPIYKKSDYPTTKYYTKSDTALFKNLKIITTMVSAKKGEPYGCRCWLKTYKKDKLISEKRYNAEAVGGCSGIYFDKKQQSQKFFILSKFGDYEGLTILIDSNGKINEQIGGSYSISKDEKYLFSIWDSDLSGITIYDLEQNKKILEIEELDEIRYFQVYYQNKKYYIGYDDESSYSEIDLKTKKILKRMLKKGFLKKENKMKEYNNVQEINKCNCGQ